jgi:hypothetical protein
MQYGVLVMSTILAGSQNPIAIPGMGIGCLDELHAHRGDDGFLVSRLAGAEPAPICSGPTEIGSMHDQHMSVIGFMKRPLQDAWVAWVSRVRVNSINILVIFLLLKLLNLRGE